MILLVNEQDLASKTSIEVLKLAHRNTKLTPKKCEQRYGIGWISPDVTSELEPQRRKHSRRPTYEPRTVSPGPKDDTTGTTVTPHISCKAHRIREEYCCTPSKRLDSH